jgi:glucosylceramidase
MPLFHCVHRTTRRGVPPTAEALPFGMQRSTRAVCLLAGTISTMIIGCSGPQTRAPEAPTIFEVLVTSEAGGEPARPGAFAPGEASGTSIVVDLNETKQTIDGIGSSFTESSAFVLAHLEPGERRRVMESLFGESGANFSLTRTHIGACDFSVEGKYSYADVAGDTELRSFSIAPDTEGFPRSRYPGVVEPAYDLLPMIREAQAIKGAQGDELRIIASAWTAPAWMKDIQTWFIPGSEDNNWQGTGGSLLPEYVPTYADYLVRYLDAYEAAGVDIWGITPVNEPNGNGGHWESMHFTPESQNAFIRDHMGPALERGGHGDVNLLIYDQNRDDLEHWTDAILGDPRTAEYVYGTAIHWYASTVKVFEDTLERVNAKFPDFTIIHTEGCIDNLGNPAPNGIRDPDGFEEENWFQNDAFWWNTTATDWAYSAEWAGDAAADHPMYVPVHRYARNIIVSLDHWVTGWVDWNCVLDAEGGPNHANNFCGAPIMIDTDSGDIYYTPIFDVLKQFSRTIRPGDVALRTERRLGGLDADALHACATRNADGIVSVQLLNTTGEPIEMDLEIAGHVARVVVPANAVQTVRVRP